MGFIRTGVIIGGLSVGGIALLCAGDYLDIQEKVSGAFTEAVDYAHTQAGEAVCMPYDEAGLEHNVISAQDHAVLITEQPPAYQRSLVAAFYRETTAKLQRQTVEMGFSGLQYDDKLSVLGDMAEIVEREQRSLARTYEK